MIDGLFFYARFTEISASTSDRIFDVVVGFWCLLAETVGSYRSEKRYPSLTKFSSVDGNVQSTIDGLFFHVRSTKISASTFDRIFDVVVGF